MNIFFPIQFNFIMSENGDVDVSSNNGDRSSGSQPPGSTNTNTNKIQQLQESLDRLRQENESLCSLATAAKATEHFFQGLTQGINKAIKQMGKKNAQPSTSNQNENEATGEESDSNDEGNDNTSNEKKYPDCFDKLKKEIKSDNCGPPISDELARLLACSLFKRGNHRVFSWTNQTQ